MCSRISALDVSEELFIDAEWSFFRKNTAQMSPMPAITEVHQRPVVYCWATSWPLLMSIPCTTAEHIARETPPPIWYAVLIYNSQLASDSEYLSIIGSTNHASAKTFHIHGSIDQHEGTACDIGNRNSGDTQKRGWHDIDPARLGC